MQIKSIGKYDATYQGCNKFILRRRFNAFGVYCQGMNNGNKLIENRQINKINIK